MPSRKKAQGQERKAKAQAKNCRHGLVAVSSFSLENKCRWHCIHATINEEIQEKLEYVVDDVSFNNYIMTIVSTAVEKYPVILEDIEFCNAVCSSFLSHGTACLLEFNFTEAKYHLKRLNTARLMAGMILALKNYKLNPESVLEQCKRYLNFSEFPLFLFFSNRIPCSCLKSKLEEVDKRRTPDNWIFDFPMCFQPEKGDGFGKGRAYSKDEIGPWKDFCSNCYAGAALYGLDDDNPDEHVEIRTPKFKCERCRMAWYCTSECQSLHWQVHKYVCKKLTKLTNEERKERKKRSKQWEETNKEMLDIEREKTQTFDKLYEDRKNYATFCGIKYPTKDNGIIFIEVGNSTGCEYPSCRV